MKSCVIMYVYIGKKNDIGRIGKPIRNHGINAHFGEQLKRNRSTMGGNTMSNQYKKGSELSVWDLNPGCRGIVNQDSKANRKLKKKILRSERKRLDRRVKQEYNEDTKGGID